MSGTLEPVDLRSDTLTRPSSAMRKAMADAPVGDDVYREDPTVNLLQDRVAALLGKEAALFVPSGTMGNQLCLRTLTHPGDEVIAQEDSHILHYEGGSAAALSGLQIRPIPGALGLLESQSVIEAMRPTTEHFARTRVVEMENTHNRCGGTIWPLELMREIAGVAHAHGLVVHLDGARLWNASVATGTPLESLRGLRRLGLRVLLKGAGSSGRLCTGRLARFRGTSPVQSQAVRRSHATGRHPCRWGVVRSRPQCEPLGRGPR